MGTPRNSRALHVEPPVLLTRRSIPLAVETPEQVRVATDEVHRIEARLAEVRPQLHAAVREAKAAPRTDQQAATAAAAAGEPIPSPTAPAKRERAAELERELVAIQGAAKRAARAQDAAVREAAADWSADLLGQVDAVVAQVDDALAALDGAFDQLDQLGALVVALDEVRGKGFEFSVNWPKLGDGAARRQAALQKLTDQYTKPTSVRIGRPELMAGLALLANEARGVAGRAEPARPRHRRAAFSGDDDGGRNRLVTNLEIESRRGDL